MLGVVGCEWEWFENELVDGNLDWQWMPWSLWSFRRSTFGVCPLRGRSCTCKTDKPTGAARTRWKRPGATCTWQVIIRHFGFVRIGWKADMTLSSAQHRTCCQLAPKTCNHWGWHGAQAQLESPDGAAGLIWGCLFKLPMPISQSQDFEMTDAQTHDARPWLAHDPAKFSRDWRRQVCFSHQTAVRICQDRCDADVTSIVHQTKVFKFNTTTCPPITQSLCWHSATPSGTKFCPGHRLVQLKLIGTVAQTLVVDRVTVIFVWGMRRPAAMKRPSASQPSQWLRPSPSSLEKPKLPRRPSGPSLFFTKS